jgi:hypothetical protein
LNPTGIGVFSPTCDLTDILDQRDRDYCIDVP